MSVSDIDAKIAELHYAGTLDGCRPASHPVNLIAALVQMRRELTARTERVT